MKEVYITKTAHFLPNNPIENDQMEDILGVIDNTPSRARRIVLRNNGIKTRYYALDDSGDVTHNNAELTAGAIKKLCENDFKEGDIELLSCGTSTPDNLLPAHASMVHGLINVDNIELNTASGVCCSGMNALKYGYLAIKSGDKNSAVCTGSERVSTWMQGRKFEGEVDNLKKLEEHPVIGFKKDFLRWMLSDGAGAFLLENTPKGDCLRIEWMKAYSYANELEPCMYAGGEKMENGQLKPWSEFDTDDWARKSVFSLKQDVKILDNNVSVKGVESLKRVLEQENVDTGSIDYFLPHISSFYFGDRLFAEMEKQGVHIPKEKWFTNLGDVGNIGSASIYLIIDALLKSKKLKKGDRLLVAVPESGRFSYFYSLMTVC